MLKYLVKSFFVVCGAFVVFSFFSSGPSPVNKTEDDSSLFFDILHGDLGKGVLGVEGGEGSAVCPEDKHVIGWMNYRGEKVIVQNLPANEQPICFETELSANAEGFYTQD